MRIIETISTLKRCNLKDNKKREYINIATPKSVPTYKNLSAGITLVALVVTVVVIMILAGVSINLVINNGIFGKSREATIKTYIAQLRDDLELYIAEKSIENIGAYDRNLLYATNSNIKYNGEINESVNISNILTSLKEKDKSNFVIISGKLQYTGTDEEYLQYTTELVQGTSDIKVATAEGERNSTINKCYRGKFARL